MSDFKADLHVHTTCSDGSLSPASLIELAKQSGLSAISITDHDTLQAYENISVSNFTVGVGVEFSCIYKNEPVHILGYDVDFLNLKIKELCKRHHERRRKRNAAILEKLSLLGMPIREDEIVPEGNRGVIGRPHIAAAMLKKGYVLSFQEAFNRFLASGKCAYVPGEVITIQETLSVIKAAQGKAFLAHPHLMKNKKFVLEVLKMGFEGIEAYYAKFNLDQNKIWLKIAEENNLLFSGGSDFHGSAKPYNTLGSSWIDEKNFCKIFQKPITG